MSSTVVAYTDVNALVSDIGLVQDPNNPGNYFLYQISTPVDMINSQVSLANQKVTSLWGDLTSTPSLLWLAQAYALYYAELLLLQKAAATNWPISGMPFQAGNIGIQRLQAMQAGLAELKERAQKEMDKYYILLSDMSNIQQTAYRSPSPYVDTGGSLAWF